MKRSERQAIRKREAVERNARWSSLTGEQKIAYLNKHDLAARKQRAKLRAELRAKLAKEQA